MDKDRAAPDYGLIPEWTHPERWPLGFQGHSLEPSRWGSLRWSQLPQAMGVGHPLPGDAPPISVSGLRGAFNNTCTCLLSTSHVR